MSENLHPQIVKNIEQSEKDGGVFLKDLKAGDKLLVQTRNTLYTIVIGEDGKEHTIQGHNHYCPAPTPCTILGSTWGGSMLKVGFIGIGMCLEFSTYIGRIGNSKVITTTPIQRIEFGAQSNGVREITPVREISE